MKRTRGFTLVEVLVTISIMLILMGLAVANMRSSQIRARDVQRESEVTTLTRHLDSLYKTGYPDGSSYTYPSTTEMDTVAERDILFDDLPDGTRIEPYATTDSIVVATNSTIPVAPVPYNTYVYQPLKDNGAGTLVLCTAASDVCTRFSFYYRSETTSQPVEIKSRYR